jgi:hypothetical protein
MLGQARLPAARDFDGAAAGVGLPRPEGNQGVAQMMPFRIGADARCTDGACGQVSRIIVRPVTREVTHLALDPPHRQGPGRLVPVDLVDAMAGQIRLGCTLTEFQTLEPAQEAASVPGLDPTGQPHAANQVNWAVRIHAARDPSKAPPRQVWVDCVPIGEVDIRRDLTVCAADGEIGQVQGLLVDPGGHQVTHLLLQEGHMRGRREVAVPIDAVTKIGTMLIQLSLTKHQVKDLPPVDIDHPAR